MSSNTLPTATLYHPATFQERGVALPFTAPLAGGMRARLSRNRGIELIVRNPAGGRGVYVMPLSALTALCRTTLYDKVVSNRIGFLETITPASVRTVGRATAAEGLAGEDAMQAARAAAKAEQGDRAAVVHHLLSSLVRQVGARPGASTTSPEPDLADLDARARQTVAWIAQRLGQSAAWGVQALDALADAVTGVGVAGVNDVGRIPGLISRLAVMREQVAEWANSQRHSDRAFFAHSVCSVIDFTRSVATVMMGQTRALTDDVVGLLRYWATDPLAVVRIAERPEWMLDGWEQIYLIWAQALDNAARRVALVEIADYLPAIPTELNKRGAGKLPMDDVFAEHGQIALNEDWRTGATVFDLIARNERLRAAAS